MTFLWRYLAEIPADTPPSPPNPFYLHCYLITLHTKPLAGRGMPPPAAVTAEALKLVLYIDKGLPVRQICGHVSVRYLKLVLYIDKGLPVSTDLWPRVCAITKTGVVHRQGLPIVQICGHVTVRYLKLVLYIDKGLPVRQICGHVSVRYLKLVLYIDRGLPVSTDLWPRVCAITKTGVVHRQGSAS
ncbi:hypothetical protein J6590_095798 [Homalodisca vitripennis]|nr:hypothetical protein J6590_067355 [Homalodisca vitripennis]KAG8255314.1 hypothetical protein J6590_095798 [Homalodisca vitripennis]